MRVLLFVSFFFACTPYHYRNILRGRLQSSQMIHQLSSASNDHETREMTQSRQSFLEWAQEHAVPLDSNDDNGRRESFKAIGDAIGNSHVVVLSEGFHNCREMMSLHYGLIQYLVEHHGFTSVVTETALPESRLIHDYIQNRIHPDEVDTDTLYRRGLNKMYGEWVEGRSLIEWMRQYNLDHGNLLSYYGSDHGGFYQDWKTPFQQIFDYLQLVDTAFAKGLEAELKPFLDIMSHNARVNYEEKLGPSERCRLEGILDKALEKMDLSREGYIDKDDKKGDTEFEWARQSLESMRLAEHYYRNYYERCRMETSKFHGLTVREVAIHRNTLWALTQEQKRLNDTPKMIVISHVAHTKTETQYQGELWGFLTPAGEMLKQSLGNNFFVIGTVYGRGNYWKAWQKGREDREVAVIPPFQQDGIESIMEKVKESPWFLHWKVAPCSAQAWLSSILSMRENDYFLDIRPKEWDACIFFHKANPATPVLHEESVNYDPRR